MLILLGGYRVVACCLKLVENTFIQFAFYIDFQILGAAASAYTSVYMLCC